MAHAHIIRSLGACWCLAAPALLNAQLASSLTGRVTDATTSRPLPEARVSLHTSDTAFTTATDESGRYRFTALPTGIHALRVTHPGHAPAGIPEVWVRAGRTEVQDVELEATGTVLGEVAVAGGPHRMRSAAAQGALTVEQSLRYPATFSDPTRLATTQPGVATMSDQSNHFSVRGNGPAANAYLLEGAEIVTPNHLTNAGTVTDLPSLTGGGTNILSAQMLGPSRLRTGAMPASHGNALGGIMDMRLRRGTHERQAYTLQAGLTGLDVSTEGPFRKGSSASYLVNYRYSTVGLLSDLGVDLSDERIGFQDLSMHVALPIGRSQLSVFGLGGLSHNYFTHKDSADREVDKDGRDIDYGSRMGAAGLTLLVPIGERARWRTTAVISAIDQEREEVEIESGLDLSYEHRLMERKIAVVTDVQGRMGGATSYRIGGNILQRTVLVERQAGSGRTELGQLSGTSVETILLRPFTTITHEFGPGLRLEAGAAYAHDSHSGVGIAEPRADLSFRPGDDHELQLTIGQRSQLDRVQYYPTSTFGPTRMEEAVFAYDHAFRPHLRFHVELYHQRILGVPQETGPWYSAQGDPFGSLVNLWDEYREGSRSASGRATNSGLEIGITRTFHRDLFYQVNLSVMDATFTAADGGESPARWNNSYLGNVIVGREFSKRTEARERTWGVNGRFHVAGGLRTTPIHLEASRAAGTTVYDTARLMDEQLPTFHRIDLRVYLKRARSGRTGMWALDLQNVLGTRNTAFRYYDRRQDKVITKYQLGLIPNLSYRIEF